MARGRLEDNLAVDRTDDGREDVRIRVVRDVTGDLRNATPVQDPLGLEFGLNYLIFGAEETGKEPKRTHNEEEFVSRLLAADRR
jgi:hypothetical protein